MDNIDIRILELLQADGRMANIDLARELKMAPSAVLERVRKLEQQRIIVGFAAQVEPKLVGLGLAAFIMVQVFEGHSTQAGGVEGGPGRCEGGVEGHSTQKDGEVGGHSTNEGESGCCTIANALAAIPEVLEVHNVAGEDCFLIKVRVQDASHLARLLREKIRSLPAIRSTRTMIVMETNKETTQLPLDQLSGQTGGSLQ